MLNRTLKCGALALALTVPAVALAATTTYTGRGTVDPAAKIELVVAKNSEGKRKIRRITVDRLRYEATSFGCSSSGRTGELRMSGPFRIRRDNRFRAVGQVTSGLGELKVVGRVKPAKAVGRMRFTFGKDGCRTNRTRFRATP